MEILLNVYKMAKSGNARARKPRKRRQSINFLTPREKSLFKRTSAGRLLTTPENADEGSQSASGSKEVKSVSSTSQPLPTGQRDKSSVKNVLEIPLARKKNSTIEKIAHTTISDNHDNFTFKSAKKPPAYGKVSEEAAV